MIPVLGGAKGSGVSQPLLVHSFSCLMRNRDAGSTAGGAMATTGWQQSLATAPVTAIPADPAAS